MVVGIVQQVTTAATANNRSDLENLMALTGNDAACRAAIEQYSSAIEEKLFGPGMVRVRRNDDADVFGVSASPAATVQPENRPNRKKAVPGATPSQRPDTGPAARAAGMKVIATKCKAGSTPSQSQTAGKLLSSLKRRVFNCLGCGKVYDCRTATSDNLAMVTAGACTFCGQPLPAVTGSGREADGGGAVRGAGASEADAAAAEQEARDFKDRLVDYDRNAAERSTVIDDQSDFFEIDSNVWLSEEERSQFKEQQLLEEARAEENRRKIVVTVDLMGRQVLMARQSEADSSVSFVLDRNHQQVADSARATNREKPQGAGSRGGSGGSAAAASAAAAAAAAAGTDFTHMLHCMPAPGLAGPAPTFVPTKTRTHVSGRRLDRKCSTAVSGNSKTAWTKPRVVDDDVFEQFAEDVQVMFENTLDAEDAADRNLGAQQE